MSTLRSLRLLGAIEAGTVNGAQLQTFLTDIGRSSELSALLTSRGQSRRMAGSPLTMTTITGSQAAIDIIFKAATTATSAACQAVVASAIGMNTVANSKSSLQTLSANTVAWSLYSTSTHYEVNVRTTIAHLANVNPALYATVDALVTDSVAMADIAATPYSMTAVVSSPATTTLVAANAVSMALVAGNPVAIDIVAKQTSVMGIIASSPAAMTEIVSRATATQRMATNPGAITAISASSTGWASYFAGPFFSANLPTIIANLIGLNPASYPTLTSIIADPVALAKLSQHKNAIAALASNSSALTNLANSPNLSIMLGSSIAMSVLGPNTSAMSSFLGVSGAWSTLFSSSVSKGYIVESTALVDVIAANSSLLTYLGGMTKTAQPNSVPDGISGNYQAFDSTVPLPGKILVLNAKEVGIAATFSNYQFKGTPQSGSQAGNVLSLTGTYFSAHVAGYTNFLWDFKAAGVTAATIPIIKYVDMT